MIRRAADEDVPRLLTWMSAFNVLEGIDWSPASGEPALRRLLGDPSLGYVGIAETDGPIGYFVVTWGYDLEWDGRDAFLTEIYVQTEHRGRGQGRRLLSAVEAVARAEGARALHLMVRSENLVALRLYESAGYTSPPRVFYTKVLGA
jgi:ribosomal protein S18 acetylase RimI-like enzyme